MKRFNRWFAAPVVVGALVVFSGCFAQTEPTPEDGQIGEAQDAVGEACNPLFSCPTPSDTCCVVGHTSDHICRDLSSDVSNCGSCGHVCGGCTGGNHAVCSIGFCGCIP
jgi:hypothetical protein